MSREFKANKYKRTKDIQEKKQMNNELKKKYI